MLKLFVASSSVAKAQAKEFIKDCPKENITYVPWWDRFVAGRTLLEELDLVAQEVQGAIIVLTPQGITTNNKGNQIVIPNLNVLFEFGYFYSKFGKNNVLVLKYGKVNLPSDLGGYIHAFGSDYFKQNAKNPTSKRTHKEFDKWYDCFITSAHNR